MPNTAAGVAAAAGAANAHCHCPGERRFRYKLPQVGNYNNNSNSNNNDNRQLHLHPHSEQQWQITINSITNGARCSAALQRVSCAQDSQDTQAAGPRTGAWPSSCTCSIFP
ncbi:hypothetical protein AWZ03_013617 [Drosophila navojoa]|uniref:Uncharacterized protein n=1 Tax=Drosophila navojoa TaxID=7232 RepID=A0A484ATM0_DRONA|nr:hypothetical protein AWZ03_013617 [Drosophila navojoa]